MKNKPFSTLVLLLMFTISSSLNTLLAQSVITGTLLGRDGKPMKKCLVLMGVGSPEETPSSFSRTKMVGFATKRRAKDYIF